MHKSSLEKYIDKFGIPRCYQCGSPVNPGSGFHMVQIGGGAEKDTLFAHWDCEKDYSTQVQEVLDKLENDRLRNNE